MGAVVDRGQVLEVQVGIDLGRGDVGVAEQFLHGAQVAGRLQQMAGEGVPQHVRVQVLAQLADAGLAHPQLDRPRRQALAAATDEHRTVFRSGLGAQRQPGFERLARGLADRQLADLVALATHSHQAFLEVQPFEIEADQFREAQPGGIEQLQQGLVAAGDEVILHGTVEQLQGAVGVEGPGQLARTLRRAQAVGRVVPAAPFA